MDFRLEDPAGIDNKRRVLRSILPHFKHFLTLLDQYYVNIIDFVIEYDSHILRWQ